MTDHFIQRVDPDEPAVLWKIILDERGEMDPAFRCRHVRFVWVLVLVEYSQCNVMHLCISYSDVCTTSSPLLSRPVLFAAS